jgi:hypothetical protein
MSFAIRDPWRIRREAAGAVVPLSDPHIDPDAGDGMEFRMTYEGPLLSHRENTPAKHERAVHKHTIRRVFHKQLDKFWHTHPSLISDARTEQEAPMNYSRQRFNQEGFTWLPMVTEANGLICKLDILMLREGRPGQALADVDNRLKTVFDALKIPKGPEALGSKSSNGIQTPQEGETPFYVLLEDDKLITHVSVTTDTLLQPIEGVPNDLATRLVIDVKVLPYRVTMMNLLYT